jgi:uncharacterized protein YggE
LKETTARARAKAEAIASGLGLNVVRIIAVEEEHAGETPVTGEIAVAVAITVDAG